MTTHSGDSLLSVRFFQHPVELAYQSGQEGRPIFEMRDYVRIEVPGNQLSIIDTLANDDHKRRFPIQWAQYQNSMSGNPDGAIHGTLLRDWPLLTAAQVNELQYFRFYTVEQIANASDLQLQSIGMVAGMSPIALRDKARAYLAQAKDSSVVMQQADELSKRDAQLRAQAEQLQEMQERLRQLTEQTEGRDAKRSPGRPKKQEQATA